VQSEIHEMLTLGMLIEIGRDDSQKLFKELVFMSHRLSISVNFTPVSLPKYEKIVVETQQEMSRFTVTMLARTLQCSHLATVSKIISDHGLNINNIVRLSNMSSLTRINMATARTAFELRVSGLAHSLERMREDLYKVSLREPIDLAVQEDDLFRRNRRLILFDMDSTLIQCEVIDELAKVYGVGDQVSEITEAAMQVNYSFFTPALLATPVRRASLTTRNP
jgi:phosphoserine phosphatase